MEYKRLTTSDKQFLLDYLNSKMLKENCEGKIGIGSGSLEAKYVFIGQNPGQTIYNGYKFFSNKKDGSSKILLPILEELDILQDSYITNIVHSTTANNEIPTKKLTDFWWPYFKEELRIVSRDNTILITMGNWAHSILLSHEIKHEKIWHPSYILSRRPDLYESYKLQIKNVCKL